MTPIGNIVKLRKEKVDKKKMAFEELTPISIHFDGSITKRVIKGDKKYTMDMFYAYPGDIVVSKIDLKNGALGIVPDGWEHVAVTNHFAVYEPIKELLLPEYLFLLIQTPTMKRYLWNNKVGAEGRKEVKLDFFKSIEIPVPNINRQNELVQKWGKSVEKIAEMEKSIQSQAILSERKILDLIGIKLIDPKPRKGAFSVAWNNLNRWDTFYFREDFIELSNSIKNLKNDYLGNLINFTTRPWAENDFSEDTFKYIEISAVNKIEGIIGYREIEKKKPPSRATTLIKTGDIMISTTRPYLGAFTVVPAEYDNCVCSSGFSIADDYDKSRINKDFLMFFLKSHAGLRQMEQRMTGGLYPAITQDELEKIIVPLPDLDLQVEIIKNLGKEQMCIAKAKEELLLLKEYQRSITEAFINELSKE